MTENGHFLCIKESCVELEEREAGSTPCLHYVTCLRFDLVCNLTSSEGVQISSSSSSVAHPPHPHPPWLAASSLATMAVGPQVRSSQDWTDLLASLMLTLLSAGPVRVVFRI